MTCPGRANHEPITDITDEVRAKLTSHTRGIPVLQLPTTDDDSGSVEKVTTPAHRKRGPKAEKFLTSDTIYKDIQNMGHIGEKIRPPDWQVKNRNVKNQCNKCGKTFTN